MNSDSKALFDPVSSFGRWRPQGLAKTTLWLLGRLPPHPIFRRLAFLLRKPIKLGRQPFYDCQIWGLKLRLCARGNLTEQRWLTMEQFHDRTEREVLRASLPEGGVFLDVGANAGFYTFWVLAQCRNSRVLAVEPSRVMLDRLTFNLKLNELESRVRLFGCAATSTLREVAIIQGTENLGQTKALDGGAGERVSGRPLLDILTEDGTSRLDAMKIDIEGFESEVLASFFSTAPVTLWPKLVIGEVVGGDGALKNLLSRYGYTLSCVTRINGVFVLKSK